MPEDEALLSFVIPVLNEADRLPIVLGELRQRFPGAQTIVVDGGSADGSVAAGLRAADVVLLGAPGRAAQMNLGAAVATGQWLCFLHADTVPQFDARTLVPALDVARQRGRRWAFCAIALRGRPRALRFIAWAMRQRSRLTGVATGDQMLIVEKSLFEELCGFAGIPLMEDVELCKRLRKCSAPAALPLVVASSGRRWEERGVLTTILLMWGLRLAYWMGVSPDRLWQHYYGSGLLVRERDA